MRHLLTGKELSRQAIESILERADYLKKKPNASNALTDKSVALLFQKPSTRTRVSFEVGVHELKGFPLLLQENDLQLSRGESIRDTAMVLSRHVAAIGMRTDSQAKLEQLAEHSLVPVFNMLTNKHHPCQVLADLMTIKEEFGTLENIKLTYLGDGNNMARSLALLGNTAGMEVTICSPPQLSLEKIETTDFSDDPVKSISGAQVLYTDVWTSMSDSEESVPDRRQILAPFQINEDLLRQADPTAIVLHCLPAHPGEEITRDVLYGKQQRIWDQAENRRHAQKALLETLLSDQNAH